MVRASLRLGLFGLFAACSSAPSTYGTDFSGVSVGDLVDITGDGRPDGRAVSATGNGTADGVDTNGDGLSDQPLTNAQEVTNWPTIGSGVDTNGDGVPDGMAIDTDANGIADAVDTNGDGMADALLIPPAPGGDGNPMGDGNSDGDIGADGSPDGSGDGTGDGDGGCGSIDQTAEFSRGPVDIVLAIDTSGSMADEVCNVSKNLTTFANNIGDTARLASVYRMDLDLQIAAQLACQQADPLANTALASDASRYLHVNEKVNSTDALQVLLDQYDNYKSFLRPDAPTHFLVVSDDESDVPAATFLAEMEAKLGHKFYFHAIVADGQNGCEGSGIGTDHLALADQTGGEKLSICATDWSALFTELEAAVVQSAPLPCDFTIPEPTDGSEIDPDAVQVVFTPVDGTKGEFPRAGGVDQCGDATGWYYDDPKNPTRIQFCPNACTAVKAGGAVGIAFGCAPIEVPF